ncbi:helix-turn-helix domain-containing protein [Prevotella sp. OH937_COT-195]|uniref:AlbA family DNA-binding domain-containing protein n=1 Tax=Prevotella sp. OH937_COT-195 TaxID=2491051 RepID=UPI000F645EC0|nr:RNA-binding domain-containing protein [Prevotella sp. OH937_COT-195]RRD02549.1 hypothetical protein EII32_02510 [Prevotella sp. OH937_COT-195]
MTEQELEQNLIKQYSKENEGCEWKEFKNMKNGFNGHEKDDVISYVSALANMEGGHLVIGVEDKTLKIVGTNTYNYTIQQAVLRLTDLCANLSSEGLNIEEFVTDDTQKTVWVIHIPKHQPKLPVYAHNKAWQRIEDSLVELTPERLNAILEETSPTYDWSAETIAEVTLDDLEPKALQKAREEYKSVHPRVADEVDTWYDMELLGRAGVAVKDKLTRAAVLLLGKPTAVHFLAPSVATVTWVLIDGQGEKMDYEHFTIPFMLTVDETLAKIRNLNQRILPGGTLFPDIVKQYDDYSIREILHNAIAHQDYTMQKRVTMVETSESVTFSNGGYFLPGSVRNAIEQTDPQKYYRNYVLSAYTAKTVDDKELKMEYIRNKSFNYLHFKDMIVQYLRSFGGATRAELNMLLQSKLSDVLTEEQKIRKIGNMLFALKHKGVIKLSEKKSGF